MNGNTTSSPVKNQPNDIQEVQKSLVHVTDLGHDEHKCLLVVNQSNEATITVFIYPSWSKLCVVSIRSKIIQPKEKNLIYEEAKFKFKIVADFKDDRKKKVLQKPIIWVKDQLLRITESLDCTAEDLANYPEEKRVCLRKMHLRNELSITSGKVNLYDILGLDMAEIRKLDVAKQRTEINKAFREKIIIWHPDKNFGDAEIAIQIIQAREILLDDEKRACYHNEADYDEGWLSPKRYMAIFWPDCYTEEQKTAYWRRIFLTCVSLGIFIGGVGLTAVTAGFAAPGTVACGAVFGGGLTGAGMLSGFDTINKKSVTGESDFKTWLAKAGFGFVGGAVTGGAAVGITSEIVGIGSAALESSAVTLSQYAGLGAATGAVGGVSSSLTADAAKKLVDGEEVTWKQTLGHALVGGTIGAATGSLTGMVTKAVVNRQETAASATLEGEIAEQVVILTGARRFGYNFAQSISRKLTESGTKAVMETAAQFLEERLDDSVENQHPMDHVVDAAKNMAAAVGKTDVCSAGTTVFASISGPPNVEKPEDGTLRGENFKNDQVEQESHCQIRYDMADKNSEPRIEWKKTEVECSYETPAKTGEQLHSTSGGVSDEFDAPSDEEKAGEESREGTIRYKFEGFLLSKMIVAYFLNGQRIEKEASGSGKIVKVPLDATKVEVRFQVMCPTWGDVMKYDRFTNTWCEPAEPHVFRYEQPPSERTFTVDGIFRMAVIRVSDCYHEETREME
ncbi:uncharacterized protein LOC114517499 [Dendronephthya gigantea]|uniref:uncharacterized protein LOC114517499 n=1 Tax=Dendronephthya gigantea TaxID=151771 RepID=UPI00106C582F|nr:uncharacterized protein LOC114517499 [Dendronephthya gigantea]